MNADSLGAMMKIICVFLFLVSSAWAFDHEHKIYADILASSVVKKGPQSLVNYKAIKTDPSKLKKYINELSKVSREEYTSWSKEQKLATLINAYNAWTIQLIVDHYPVSSIKKIGPFYSTPWKQEFIKWLGGKRSLDDIEHKIIRKDFSEPRIHFALVCAAMGCPSLQVKPFLAQNLEAQLQNAAHEFLHDTAENRHEVKGDKVILHLSSIFKWYGNDFGTKDELVKFIVKEMNIQNKVQGKKVELEYLDYDWNLNAVK
jgi:hypothetical protein